MQQTKLPADPVNGKLPANVRSPQFTSILTVESPIDDPMLQVYATLDIAGSSDGRFRVTIDLNTGTIPVATIEANDITELAKVVRDFEAFFRLVGFIR